MASTSTSQAVRQTLFVWEGRDQSGQLLRGQLHAASATLVHVKLRRQGILSSKVSKKILRSGKKITQKDIALFTRQLATMLQAGIPMLQAFDIVAQGQNKASLSSLIQDLRTDIAGGTSLFNAFRQYPQQFDATYCNLLSAGEQAGILDTLLARLARDQEKSLALKGKVKSALIYPLAVLAVAVLVTSVIMIYVVPTFKDVFSSFGAVLPAPTRLVLAMSEALVHNWPWICGTLCGACGLMQQIWRRSPSCQRWLGATLLALPGCGPLLHKAGTARWSRTLAAMFAAGVPLSDALAAVGAAAGSALYREASARIRSDVASGSSLTLAMDKTKVFPNLVLQMVAIGEQAGALDAMLDKVADFYEAEVEQTLAALLSLLEPLLITILGLLVGALVVALYLPIFQLGAVI